MKAARQKHERGSKKAKHSSAISLQSDPLVIWMDTSSCTHISRPSDNLPKILGIWSGRLDRALMEGSDPLLA